MSLSLRVFVNATAVDVVAGATALDCVRSWKTEEADAVVAGKRTISDSRGLPIPTDSPARAGSIFRTVTNRPSAHVFTSAENDTRGTAQLAASTWTHLAATYDGSTLRLYVNGTLASSKAVGGSMAPSTGPLQIGGNTIWPEWFAGQIDEVRVYNRVLSATEVQQDMSTPVKPIGISTRRARHCAITASGSARIRTDTSP